MLHQAPIIAPFLIKVAIEKYPSRPKLGQLQFPHHKQQDNSNSAKTEIHMNPKTITKLFIASTILTLGAVSHAGAVVWNVDTTKTSTVYGVSVAGPTPTFFVANDPIDIGYWGGSGYVPVPYFSTLMSGYSSGAQIASVDSFSLNLTISHPVSGTNPFNLNLYVYTGADGNTSLATTGNVTTADWNFPEFTANTFLLQSNFLTPSSLSGTYSLDATGRANLLSYLQSNYVTNEYLTFTFRMATNSVTGSDDLYRFGSNADLTGSLQTTVVPEPSSFGLLLFGSAVILLTYRRFFRRTPA